MTMGFYQKHWHRVVDQEKQQQVLYTSRTFPIPLILWLPMPSMVHGEGVEGGTEPLFSGTTTAPITLGPSGLISHFGAYWSLLNADNKDWFFFCFMFGIWIKWASFGSKKQSQYDKYKTQEKSQTIHYFYKL